MLPDKHRQITLRSGTGYDGRIDPVRKVKIQSQETVIECQSKQEIISLSSWEVLEECPFCNAPTGNVIRDDIEGGVSLGSTKKPEQKPSPPPYGEGYRDSRRFQTLALLALLLIACLGIGGVTVYFSLNGSDTELSGNLSTPNPIAEMSVTSSSPVESSVTPQLTVIASATIRSTSTSTPRPSPTKMTLPTRTPTRIPSPTATRIPPSSTPAPTFTSVPVTCSLTPGPRWGPTLWNQYQSRLGCPLSQEIRTGGAYQLYQRGIAVWRQDVSRIYILYNNGTFAAFPDNSPSGYYDTNMLKGGFGYLWNNNSSVRDGLGQPTTVEANATNFAAQDFERGAILYFFENEAYNYILFSDNNTWTSTQR